MPRVNRSNKELKELIKKELNKIARDFRDYGKHVVEDGKRKDEEVQMAYILSLGFFFYKGMIETGKTIPSQKVIDSFDVEDEINDFNVKLDNKFL